MKLLDIPLHVQQDMCYLMVTFVMFKWYKILHIKENPPICWMTLVEIKYVLLLRPHAFDLEKRYPLAGYPFIKTNWDLWKEGVVNKTNINHRPEIDLLKR